MQEICALRICGAAYGGENGRSENRATVPQGERRQTVRVLWEGGCEMIYIGIDPGKDGGYAVIYPYNDIAVGTIEEEKRWQERC